MSELQKLAPNFQVLKRIGLVVGFAVQFLLHPFPLRNLSVIFREEGGCLAFSFISITLIFTECLFVKICNGLV